MGRSRIIFAAYISSEFESAFMSAVTTRSRDHALYHFDMKGQACFVTCVLLCQACVNLVVFLSSMLKDLKWPIIVTTSCRFFESLNGPTGWVTLGLRYSTKTIDLYENSYQAVMVFWSIEKDETMLYHQIISVKKDQNAAQCNTLHILILLKIIWSEKSKPNNKPRRNRFSHTIHSFIDDVQ